MLASAFCRQAMVTAPKAIQTDWGHQDRGQADAFHLAGNHQTDNLYQKTNGCRGSDGALDIVARDAAEHRLLSRAGVGCHGADAQAEEHDGPDIKKIEFHQRHQQQRNHPSDGIDPDQHQSGVSPVCRGAAQKHQEQRRDADNGLYQPDLITRQDQYAHQHPADQ